MKFSLSAQSWSQSAQNYLNLNWPIGERGAQFETRITARFREDDLNRKARNDHFEWISTFWNGREESEIRPMGDRSDWLIKNYKKLLIDTIDKTEMNYK